MTPVQAKEASLSVPVLAFVRSDMGIAGVETDERKLILRDLHF
jgi:hypothetical protein